MRGAALAVTLVALTSCGGGGSPPPQLFDGTVSPDLPPLLKGLAGGAAMTAARAVPASSLEAGRLRRCEDWVDASPGSGPVVERVGVNGGSLTFAVGSHMYGCDAIAQPARDPDRAPGDPWCRGAVGRLERGTLNDPRLGLCTAADGDVTAFAWIQPGPDTAWVVVRDGNDAEVYEVAGGLPVRVTTTEDVDPSGSASFDVEEYGADGTRLRGGQLDAQVAG